MKTKPFFTCALMALAFIACVKDTQTVELDTIAPGIEEPSSAKLTGDEIKSNHADFQDAFANTVHGLHNSGSLYNYAYFDFVRQDNPDIPKPTGEKFRFRVTEELIHSGNTSSFHYSLDVLIDHKWESVVADFEINNQYDDAFLPLKKYAGISDNSILVKVNTEYHSNIEDLIKDKKSFTVNGIVFSHTGNNHYWKGARGGQTFLFGTHSPFEIYLLSENPADPYYLLGSYDELLDAIEALYGFTAPLSY